MSSKLPVIPLFWDVDMTITEEYQQTVIFRKYFDKLKLKIESKGISFNSVDDYWKYVGRSHSDIGIGYLQQMIWDARVGEPFDGLLNSELHELGRDVKMAPGFVDCLSRLDDDLRGKCEINHYFISVGIKPMIEGIIEANKIGKHVRGIAASEFIEHKGRIAGIREIVRPFGKTERIIGFLKGGLHQINKEMPAEDYLYAPKNMVVIGDGLTDIAKFSYAKSKGGTPIVVYTAGDIDSFIQANDAVGHRADYILPRDYTPGGETYKQLLCAITQKTSGECPFHPELLHDYKKGLIKDPELLILVQKRLKETVNKNYFRSIVVRPNGTVEKKGSYIIPSTKK